MSTPSITPGDFLHDCLRQVERLNWENWMPLHQPTSKRGKGIKGHDFPGVYQIRKRDSHENIVIGIGKKLSKRMRSWYPVPYSSGTRKNSKKRKYLLKHWLELEFRILPTTNRSEAVFIESILLAGESFKFNT